MGYVDSAPYLCCTIDIVTNLANSIWGEYSTTPLHHLKLLAESSPTISKNSYSGLPSKALDSSLANLCAQLSLD